MLTTTAGRFFDALWLVNGNGTRTTSPNSKGIVDVVLGIAPDGGKTRSARGSGSAGQRPLLLAQTNEIDKILDLGDALGGQRLDFSIRVLLSAGTCLVMRRAAARGVAAAAGSRYTEGARDFFDPGDAALLGQAAEEGRILVTIDTDFPTLVCLTGAAHAGIIRLPDVPAPARIALMEQSLTHHGEADLASAVVAVKGSRVRFSRASPRS